MSDPADYLLGQQNCHPRLQADGYWQQAMLNQAPYLPVKAAQDAMNYQRNIALEALSKASYVSRPARCAYCATKQTTDAVHCVSCGAPQ